MIDLDTNISALGSIEKIIVVLLEQGIDGDRPRDVVHAALLIEEGQYNEGALAACGKASLDSACAAA